MADKETKWTPGPWDWDKYGLSRLGADGRIVSRVLTGVYEYDSGADIEVSEADAHLIAAAPQLYEALYALVSVESWDPETRTNVLDSARAALKAARGEP